MTNKYNADETIWVGTLKDIEESFFENPGNTERFIASTQDVLFAINASVEALPKTKIINHFTRIRIMISMDHQLNFDSQARDEELKLNHYLV